MQPSLNEHALYKRGWPGQNGTRKNYLICTKHLSEQHPKGSQNHTHSSYFWYKAVAIRSIFVKVHIVAWASTCDSCLKCAITDVQKSDEYRLLLVVCQENFLGHPHAAFSCQKVKDVVFRCLRIAQVPVSTNDRMASWSNEGQLYDREQIKKQGR